MGGWMDDSLTVRSISEAPPMRLLRVAPLPAIWSREGEHDERASETQRMTTNDTRTKYNTLLVNTTLASTLLVARSCRLGGEVLV